VDGHPDAVRLIVPPSSQYLRTVRLVAADAAVRAGLDCEEIEDFRIAIDELCHMLMTFTDDYIEMTVATFEDRVVAHGHARTRSSSVRCSLGELSQLIVAATTDFHAVRNAEGEIAFDVAKQTRRVLEPMADLR
jgi:hypothetical protein